MFLVEPQCTWLLGAMGAEVIKVESIQHPDTFRYYLTSPRDHWWEKGPWFCDINPNKYGVTLDLNNPKGIDIFKRLVEISDIVTENFTPRVMENFGLTYPVLKEVNSRIIMVSAPAHGLSGPWRDFAGFSMPLETFSGWAYLTGFPDGPPIPPAGPYDSIVAMHMAYAILAALEYRHRTGKGQFIEIAQVEILPYMLGAAYIDYSLNQRVWNRQGNRDPAMAPHGCYRCKGDDMWVAIAVSSDEEWQALRQAIGDPDWAMQEKFSTTIGRWHNQDELNRLIENWTLKHDHYEVMHLLQKAGIASAPVVTLSEIGPEPHAKARKFYQSMTREYVGSHEWTTPPAKFSKTPLELRMPSPTLGEHNQHVLGGILGLSQEELKTLVEEKVIGTIPLGL